MTEITINEIMELLSVVIMEDLISNVHERG